MENTTVNSGSRKMTEGALCQRYLERRLRSPGRQKRGNGKRA